MGREEGLMTGILHQIIGIKLGHFVIALYLSVRVLFETSDFARVINLHDTFTKNVIQDLRKKHGERILGVYERGTCH